MTSLNQTLTEQLSMDAAKGLTRTLPPATIHGEDHLASVIRYKDKDILNFSSNDYFGLSVDPRVITKAMEGLMFGGMGARASRLVSGHYESYTVLEHTLAASKNAEAALVFSTGYAANTGSITALMRSGDLIIADKLAHASLLDGAKQSGATLMRFAHNNVQHLEQLLEAHRGEYKHCLIITESIFSMDGDVAPTSDIAALAQTFSAWLMVDDAHGMGFTKHILNPLAPLDGVFFSGTLSKGAGALGGYIAGSKALIQYLMNHARSFIYSTALPPAVVYAAIRAVEAIISDAEMVSEPLRLAKYFTRLLNLPEAESPIVPVILGENDKAMKASEDLLEKGFYVRAIRPPTVPPNTARLRITFTALHREEDVEALAKAVQPWLKMA